MFLKVIALVCQRDFDKTREVKNMKNIFSVFIVFVLFAFTCLTVHANSNRLHNITLEKNSNGFNVILGIDRTTKLVKKAAGANELVLELKGVSSADTVNAIYKGTDSIDNMIVENAGANKLKIYITAQGISNSSVFTKTADGEISIVGESFPLDKALWSSFVFILFGVIFITAKKISEEDSKILIKKDIKEREIELYRRYRKSLDDNMNMVSKNNLKLRSMQKKIDRKIDERLTASIK